MDFDDFMADELDKLKRADRLRVLRTVRNEPRAHAVIPNAPPLINLSGNDYLGIASDPAIRQEFYARRNPDNDSDFALTSASSRLLTGNSEPYPRLEAHLGELYGGRAALVFNSGYHANIGILPALSSSKDLILSDKLNHASIIDGLRLADAEFKRYRHLDLDHLTAMLSELRDLFRNVFIVTESVFSMDGDCADLRKLVEIKEKFNAMLLVDEAHAIGVRGPGGRGLAAEQNVADRVDVLIGTFGKALASAGAFAVCSHIMRDFLINKMRPFIFTTALPPVLLAWSDFVLSRVQSMDAEREKLFCMGSALRAAIRDAGRTTAGDSQIVPLFAGSDADATALAARFVEHGILVFPIRPPTVPAGTSRLRFSLSAALDESVIHDIRSVL